MPVTNLITNFLLGLSNGMAFGYVSHRGNL